MLLELKLFLFSKSIVTCLCDLSIYFDNIMILEQPTNIIILWSTCNVQETTHLPFTNVCLCATCRKSSQCELIICWRFMMLQRAYQIVTVELPRIHAHRVHGQSIVCQSNWRKPDFSVSIIQLKTFYVKNFVYPIHF